jgi:hypothetical protein
MTELGELIADDKAVDLDAWLDRKTFLQGYPLRLVAVAQKRAQGEALNENDRRYLNRYRKQRQLALV